MKTGTHENVNILLTIALVTVFIFAGFGSPFGTPLHSQSSGNTLKMQTTAEASRYKETTLYNDVMSFIFEAQKQSEYIKVLRLTTSTEGRMVPLVTVSKEGVKSPAELAASGKPAVLIMANIHAGEIEGKEAVLMLLRDFARGKYKEWLDRQVVLLIPIFNADGNDKLGNNRRDNGPEKAGTRYNGQFLDLNRDYLKLKSPEVRALVKLWNEWDPVVTVDMHTTNGSYHREPVTYVPNNYPNSNLELADYMWKNLFPAVAKTLKEKYKYDSVPYGNFVDRTKPGKGWQVHAFNARYGNNYLGLRNRFAILDENYSHADFKTRVLSSYGFIKSILEYTNDHINHMWKMVKKADADARDNFRKKKFVLEYDTAKLFDLTIKSYVFKIEKIKKEDREKYPPWYGEYLAKKTNKHKDYKVPYFNKAKPTRTISMPGAYIILPHQEEVLENLRHHGIAVEIIRKPVKLPVEVFKMTSVNTANRLYQGNVAVSLKGSYKEKTVDVPAGSYYVSMKQPLARLIPVLLEPESEDGLAHWGFFNRLLVSQWGGKPMIYPVYRLHKVGIPIERSQD